MVRLPQAENMHEEMYPYNEDLQSRSKYSKIASMTQSQTGVRCGFARRCTSALEASDILLMDNEKKLKCCAASEVQMFKSTATRASNLSRKDNVHLTGRVNEKHTSRKEDR